MSNVSIQVLQETDVKAELDTERCTEQNRPADCNPPGSSVHGILQARILEWVAISFSRGSSPNQKRKRRSNT